MYRITNEEYNATYRIFNHVEQIIGPYYGKKTWDETAEFVSENRWVMFPVKSVTSLRDGTEYPLPNVFVSVEDEIRDDGNGRVEGFLGFTYHNVDAMQALHSILDPRRRSKHKQFIDIISRLDFPLEVQWKTKTDCPDSTPHYDTFKDFEPLTVSTVNQISQAIADSDNQLLHRGDSYYKTGNPVIWSVSIFTAIKETNPTTFDHDIKRAFEAFFQLLNLA
jgi:hypothetical protein